MNLNAFDITLKLVNQRIQMMQQIFTKMEIMWVYQAHQMHIFKRRKEILLMVVIQVLIVVIIIIVIFTIILILLHFSARQKSEEKEKPTRKKHAGGKAKYMIAVVSVFCRVRRCLFLATSHL